MDGEAVWQRELKEMRELLFIMAVFVLSHREFHTQLK
jgi:hypothetical protein